MTRTPALIVILLAVLIGAGISPSFAAEQKTVPVAVAPQVTERDLNHFKEYLRDGLATHDEIDKERIKSLEKTIAGQDKFDQERIDRWTDRLDQQDTRIGELLTFTTYISGLIAFLTLVVALGAVVSYFFSNKKAEQKISEWINKAGEKTLDKHIQEKSDELINKRVERMEEQSKILWRESVVDLNEKVSKGIQDGKIAQKQLHELNEVVKDIKKYTKTDRSFDEWFALGLKYHFEKQYDQAVNAYQKATESGDAIDIKIAMTLYNQGVALKANGQIEEAIAAYQEVVDRFGGTKDQDIKVLVAEARVNQGVALNANGQMEAAIAIYDEVERRYLDSGDEELLDKVACAQCNRSFARIKLAKESLQGDTDGADAQALLTTALADATNSLIQRPKNYFSLGNKGYALYLLGDEPKAEEAFKLAFKYGDEKFYEVTLEDAEFHPVPKDKAFVGMIKRLWAEEQTRRDALASKPASPPE